MFRGRRVSLQFTILTLFLAVVLPLAMIIVALNYRLARLSAAEAAGILVAEVGHTVANEVSRVFDTASTLADLGTRLPSSTAPPDGVAHPLLPVMINALTVLPELASLYVGHRNGDFLRVAQLGPGYDREREAVQGPAGTVLGVQTIVGAGDARTQVWRFLDAERRPLGQNPTPTPAYNPAARVWYQQANAAPGALIATAPYAFATAGSMGITIARRVDGPEDAVFAVDIALAGLSTFLDLLQGRLEHPIEVAVFDHNGVVLAAAGGASTASGAVPKVEDLRNESLRATAARFFVDGLPFDRATVATGAGPAVAGVQALPVRPGQTPRYVAVAAPLVSFVAPLYNTALISVLVSLLLTAAAMPIIVVFARQLARPLRQLAAEAGRIRNFEIEGNLRITSRITEVRELLDATELMKSALAAFSKYVPRELVRRLLHSSITPEPGGERRPATLLFTDIQGFTPLAETMDPERLMQKMSTYLDRMVGEVQRRRGTVDKFIGDAIMVYWNAPEAQHDHAFLGCAAALMCGHTSNELNRQWREQGVEELPTRFGVNTGECIVGNLGSKARLDFTVLGATVNLAARLEGLNKHYGTQVLVSKATRDATSDEGGNERFLFRTVDLVQAKGTGQPTLIYELVGAHPAAGLDAVLVQPEDVRRCAEWERVFQRYQARDWAGLTKAAEAFSKQYPSDGLAQVYLRRAWVYLHSPPPPTWDGVEKFQTK